MRDFLDQLPQCVFAKDCDGRIKWCNQSFSKWHSNYLGIDDVLEKSDFDLWPQHKDLAHSFVAVDHRVMRTQRPSGLVKEIHVLPTGATRHLETYKFPWINDNGEMIGVMGMYLDVTDRVTNEERAKDVVSFVGHSLKTSINCLQLNCDVAMGEGDEPSEALQLLESGIQTLAHTTAILTGMATLDSKPEFFDLEIDSVLENAHKAVSDARIDLVTVSDPLPTKGSEYLLVTAVTELLANATRFVPRHEDGGTIRLSYERSGDRCLIHVEDNGKGVLPHIKLKGIFRPRTTSAGSEHTGLGLNFVKRVAELHGGTAKEVGEFGQGAHFVVDIPIQH